MIDVLLGGTEPFEFDFGMTTLQAGRSRAYRSLRRLIVPILILKTSGSSLLLWVYLATSVKRLHDRDKSGWWIVPFFVVPGLYNQFSDWLPDLLVADLLLAAQHLRLWLWGFVEMYCLQGLAQDNRFGPDPLAPTSTRGRAGTSRARSKWSRPRLAPRRHGMLSRAHE